MKGLSRVWRNPLARFLGEGWRQRHSLTRPFRRGRTFGPILVNLEKHQVLDLLDERSSKSAADWMRSHPEIDYVSRDRGKQ
jgi:hypothetical protein